MLPPNYLARIVNQNKLARKQQVIMYAVDSQECDLWTIGAVPSFPFCAKNL